ncbi:Bifunctional glutamate/proline--tRNA ligase [Porphyridium purpureum]|uniref:proline--tRNA ligase n=1 Tax=Porphyridium purpureum TaxID=35688 RepID=A0A5J4YYT4_PORPP|nr:Bifunctional glutamate/proline--tRNA ligase [Porphyridium purpureum]|eukprot:POR3421..scf209_3
MEDEFMEKVQMQSDNGLSEASAVVAGETGSTKEKKEKKPKEKKAPVAVNQGAKGSDLQKQGNRDGMEVKKLQDFALWYTQLMTKAELIEYYDVAGCYILRPWAWSMWESVKEWFDGEIKKLGVENACFPLFVSSSRLSVEKDHVEGFSPEVAWVTRSGNHDLEEPIAIRPTSETIMYPQYAKWIRSHRDLPLKLNQWTNVVRWEFKHPTPFIRSREFFWQEGHTAFATLEEAAAEVLVILSLYQQIYEYLLAVPVIRGFKSEGEKFAGGLYTTTVEAFIPPNGRAVQAATSHCLGQNFGKMFDISFDDGSGKKQYVWQNSWGCTTRSLGVMCMVHGDDSGLVLPPRVAPIQVIIIPILGGKVAETEANMVMAKVDEIVSALKLAGIRVKVEDRKDKSPGWKFNHWELKGVPLRIEIGPRDVQNEQFVCVTRLNKEKTTVALADLATMIPGMLDGIHNAMLRGAFEEYRSRITVGRTWAEFASGLEKANVILVPWCTDSECEESAKKRSGAKEASVSSSENSAESSSDARALSGAAKTLCIPLEEELERFGLPTSLDPSDSCFACARPATKWTLWGRSY